MAGAAPLTLTAQGAVAQQEWRIGSLLHRLDAFLRPFLTHPYQVGV
jgi:hypothetical protein